MSNRLANYKAKLAEVQSQYLAEMPLLQYPACLKSYVKANKLYAPEKKTRAKMSEATKQALKLRKASMTEAQKAEARAKANERARIRRANMTPEQKRLANPKLRNASRNILSALRTINTPQFSMPSGVMVDLMPINAFGNKVLTPAEKRKATMAAKKAAKIKL